MRRRTVYYVDHGDRVALVAALDSRPEDIHFTDVLGGTLLHSATGKCGTAEIAEELIRRGVDVCGRDQRGATALVYAADLNRKDIAEVILRSGGSVGTADEHGNQPLWYAVNKSAPDQEMISLLLRYGADPRHRNKYGKSPLGIARARNTESVVRLLERAPASQGGSGNGDEGTNTVA